MLQIKNLTITHKKDLRTILADFSCVFNDGDKAVVVGEEGDGKSTLLKWIYDDALVEDYCEAQGEKIANGERLAYLPQELPAERQELSVCEFFMEDDAFPDKTPRELSALAGEFSLPADFFYRGQKMGTLSGGEKVKAQLMRLLLSEPTVLLLDEPSNDVDLATLKWLERLIAGWRHAVIYISHDETLIERTANMVIHLEQIRRKTESRHTVRRVSYAQYKEERERQFKNQEREAESDRRAKKLRDEKYRRIYQSVDHAQEVITRQDPSGGRLLKKKMHAVKSMEHRFAREDGNMTEMPEREDAIFFRLGNEEAKIPAGKTILNYECKKLYTPDGERLLAENISLFVRGAEKVCIIGENGAGKTTLLRRIAEELLARTDIRAKYMPQNYGELLPRDITPVRYLARTGKKEEETKIRTFLGALKYTADEMDHAVAELSGGQKAKIFLLKLSMSGANVLILDEPTRNFSPLSGPVLRKMFREFPGAVISISHDRKFIGEVCDTVYRLTPDGLRKCGAFRESACHFREKQL